MILISATGSTTIHASHSISHTQGLGYIAEYTTLAAPEDVADLTVQGLRLGTAVTTFLSWTGPSSGDPADEFNIYRDVNNTGSSFYANTTSLNYTDVNVSLNSNYTYVVRASNTDGESTGVSVQIYLQLKPTAVSNAMGIMVDELAKITWSEPFSNGGLPVTEYRIFKGDQSNTYSEVFNTTNLWFNDTDIEVDSTYYYKITAVNSLGAGDNSTELVVSDTTRPIINVTFNSSPNPSFVEYEGSLDVVVLPFDENGIERVIISIRGEDDMQSTILANLTSTPYQQIVDTSLFENGNYTVTITVYDLAGNTRGQEYLLGINNPPSETPTTSSTEPEGPLSDAAVLALALTLILLLAGAAFIILRRR